MEQGCQIFLDTIYQNGDNITNVHNIYTKWPKIKANGHKIYQMVMKDTKIIHSKAFQNIQNGHGLFIQRPYKMYQNWGFG
jgi:hypothetical protein